MIIDTIYVIEQVNYSPRSFQNINGPSIKSENHVRKSSHFRHKLVQLFIHIGGLSASNTYLMLILMVRVEVKKLILASFLMRNRFEEQKEKLMTTGDESQVLRMLCQLKTITRVEQDLQNNRKTNN